MLTVQEIQAMSFEKAVFGGYDMKSVDEFVEQMTEDYAALQKENAALKSKMKVLVDKIEEYRSVEDGMRRALVSAQSIAQETIDKAKLESEQLIQTTKGECETQLAAHQARLGTEEQRLNVAKQQSAAFIAKLTAFYEAQLSELVDLSAMEDLQLAAAVPAVPNIPAQPAEKPSEKLEKTRDFVKTEQPTEDKQKEYAIPEDIRQFMDQHQSDEDGMRVKMMEVTLGDQTAKENKDEKPTFSFGELKFGSDYSAENDK